MGDSSRLITVFEIWGLNGIPCRSSFRQDFDGKFYLPDDSSMIYYGPCVIQRMRCHKYQYVHVPDFPLNQECTS